MRPTRAVLLWALAGTIVAVCMCLADLSGRGDSLGHLVSADPTTPRGQLLVDELPGYPIRAGGGHDGTFFYVLARDPFHLTADAPYFDRPRYRAQRIAFPLASWALHPTGGGPGLLWTMFAVGVAGVFLGSWVTGRLSLTLGGPAWTAVLFGVLPGAATALRITVADSIAFALTLTAVWLSLRRRNGWAIAVAVLAVLTKESMLVTLAGFALWRRDKDGVALVAAPLVVAGAWWLYLRQILPDDLGVTEITPPFGGWSRAIPFWQTGIEPLGLFAALFGVLVAAVGLAVTRPKHPLWWATLLNLAAMAFYSEHVIAPERNSTRMFLVLQLLGLLLVFTRKAPDTVRPARDAGSAATAEPATVSLSTPATQ